MTRPLLLVVVAALAVATACRMGASEPAALDPGHATCAYCRMGVTDQRYASQVLVPGESPRFFDDLGCLKRYLADADNLPVGTRVFVADHRTRAWVAAADAIYTRVDSVAASMGSHIIAHESVASRQADPDAQGGTSVPPADLLPASLASR
jgi:copper chaperone NosL